MDNEIVKAWEWHISPVHSNGMKIYSAVVECSRELAENTLDFINRQKAENEELRADYNYLFETMPRIKTESINEFAEKLKEYFPSMAGAIDHTVEELLKIERNPIGIEELKKR